MSYSLDPFNIEKKLWLQDLKDLLFLCSASGKLWIRPQKEFLKIKHYILKKKNNLMVGKCLKAIPGC